MPVRSSLRCRSRRCKQIVSTLAGNNYARNWHSCPLLFVLGEQDQMTPPKAAKGLIEAAKGAGKTVSVQIIPNGHNQMTESPDATLFAIRDFLAA